MNFIVKFLGSGFYTGYLKYASGTFGSIAALIIYLIPGFERTEVIIPAIILFIIIGIPISSQFETVYGKDPSECTIDEVVGMWISLLFVPKKVLYISIAFIIWRLLDIIKPYPARQAERLPAGFGIMTDDIISAVYSALLMNFVVIRLI